MSEINAVDSNSSKQLISLAKSLKNREVLQDRFVGSLMVKHNVEKITNRKIKHRFSRHPDHISSESDSDDDDRSVAIKNGYSESLLSYNFSKNCNVSVTHSEHSILSNHVKMCTSVKHKRVLPANECFDSETPTSKMIENKKTESNPLQKVPPNLPKLKLHNDDNSNVVQPCATQNGPKEHVPNKTSEASSGNVSKKNIDHKLRSYLQRIYGCLEDIRIIMITGIDLPDGDDGWEKARTRTIEFSSRFTRNYLYQIGREVTELEDIARQSGGHQSHRTKNIHHHLLTSHQIIAQALQVYKNHMLTLLANALVDKLQYIVEQIRILCKIHMKYLNLGHTGSNKRETLINNLVERCKDVIDAIENSTENQMKAQFATHGSKLALLGYKVNIKKPGRLKTRKRGLDTKLSMYSISSLHDKNAFWRKTVENLAKDKLRYNHVQSRYKTANYKHRPPPPLPAKPTVVELPTKSKLFGKRSSCLLRNTPIHTPDNEDEIMTLVEMHKEVETHTNNVVREDHLNITENEQQTNSIKDMQLQTLTPLIQGLCHQIYSQESRAMTQQQLEIVLKSLLGMALEGKINCATSQEIGPKKNDFIAQSETTTVENAGNRPKTVEDNKEKAGVGNEKENMKKNRSQEILDNSKGVNCCVEFGESNNLFINHNIHLGNSVTSIEEHSHCTNVKNISSCSNVREITKELQAESEQNKFKKSDNTLTNKKKNSKKRQTVSVTGAKNAQLICIRDENSIILESQDETPTASEVKNTVEEATNKNGRKDSNDSEIKSKKNPTKSTPRSKSSDKDNSKNNTLAGKTGKANIKISRLPKKTLKQLVLMPKDHAINIIQYKLKYNKFAKGNHMYQKSSKVQPWLIVDMISDHLLNDLLLAIAKEIQVDKILERLYQSEFQ